MFGSNIHFPASILSYEAALQRHNSIAPIRGRSTDVRPVAQRRNDNFTIRLDPKDQSVAVRLYQTDIIVYRPDGTIELEPYASRLTDDAVSCILRGGVTPQYDSPVGPVLWAKAPDSNGFKRGYRIPDFAVLDKDFRLIAGAKPFTKFTVDRKLSKAACRDSGFDQFALWFKTQLRLGFDPRQGGRWSGLHVSDATVRSLDEPDRYADIVREWPSHANPADQLSALRQCVVKYHGAVTETELPYVSDWRGLTSVVSSKRRLG